MIALHVTIDGGSEFFGAMRERASDLRSPISDVLEDALSEARLEISASKGALHGAPWTPMKFFTTWFHKRDPTTLLEHKGDLLSSLNRGGTNNIFNVTETFGEAGTSDRKAGWQQRGTARTFLILQFLRHGTRAFHEPGITPRPFLLWHAENFGKYEEIFASHIAGTNAV